MKIRKAELTMDEQKKYEVIKELADHSGGNKKRAALVLGCTVRHINRMLAGYRKFGKAFFVHGNRGRKSPRAITEECKSTVVKLYRQKYYDANYQHFTELLARFEGIHLSVSSVRKILEEAQIFSPRMTKAKKRRLKKELDLREKEARSPKEAAAIQSSIIALEQSHPKRSRCAYFGELIQMDASSIVWFGHEKTTLHVAVDDMSGAIVGAWFDKEETLSGYYHVLEQILKNYGVPYKFLTDKRTVFTYKSKNSSSVEDDTYTQFAYACKQLGIELVSTSVPQAKGRVERLNGTLQGRLPIEMRQRGVSNLREANEFLNSYVKEFNAKWLIHVNNSKSVFVTQPSDEKINLLLAVLTERTVDDGHSIKFKKEFYRMLDKDGKQVCYRKGTKVMAIQAFDGRLFCSVNDKGIYALEAIPEIAVKSPDFDPDYEEPRERKKYIPPMNHPWRRATFKKFVNSQQHRAGFEKEDIA